MPDRNGVENDEKKIAIAATVAPRTTRARSPCTTRPSIADALDREHRRPSRRANSADEHASAPAPCRGTCRRRTPSARSAWRRSRGSCGAGPRCRAGTRRGRSRSASRTATCRRGRRRARPAPPRASPSGRARSRSRFAPTTSDDDAVQHADARRLAERVERDRPDRRADHGAPPAPVGALGATPRAGTDPRASRGAARPRRSCRRAACARASHASTSASARQRQRELVADPAHVAIGAVGRAPSTSAPSRDPDDHVDAEQLCVDQLGGRARAPAAGRARRSRRDR